jgi:hypothetical protein
VVGAVRCAGSAGGCTCAWVSMTGTETGIGALLVILLIAVKTGTAGTTTRSTRPTPIATPVTARSAGKKSKSVIAERCSCHAARRQAAGHRLPHDGGAQRWAGFAGLTAVGRRPLAGTWDRGVPWLSMSWWCCPVAVTCPTFGHTFRSWILPFGSSLKPCPAGALVSVGDVGEGIQ